MLVEGINVAGDDQADRRVHGGETKAVYAYAAEDYDWWTGELGRPVGPGTFGDNLTLAGVDLVLHDGEAHQYAQRHVGESRQPHGGQRR